MNRITITDGFLSQEETSSLITMAGRTTLWETRGHKFWDGRVLDLFNGFPHFLGDYISEGIAHVIVENYGDLFQDGVYFDTLDLVKWPVGHKQPPHQDNIPHKHRLVGCVVYLNDDFSGGETFYPNLGVSNAPKAGTMVLHLGDEEHLHGVSEVIGKDRFTISSFWGTDKGKSHRHILEGLTRWNLKRRTLRKNHWEVGKPP